MPVPAHSKNLYTAPALETSHDFIFVPYNRLDDAPKCPPNLHENVRPPEKKSDFQARVVNIR